jgi:hypothetical protein
MNPYSKLRSHQLWRRAVSNVSRQEFDPVVSVKFAIGSNDRIATAGSCFAQHISRRLDQIGFNYFVPEAGENLSEKDRRVRNYRVFSARFGNIYTTRQLVQLFDEAFAGTERAEAVWERPDGRFVDPYRPQIEPDGFADPEAVRAARIQHLGHVRTMFEQADVFVFTLGLTESWVCQKDGSVFPLAPGVVAGSFVAGDHGFVNFTAAEVESDLRQFLDKVKVVNPGLKVLLTVSPVSLIATYEDRNVLVATTYSKSVLRVAADMIWREYDWVDYFPSYEIITGSYNSGMYYCSDARDVNSLGVAHAMRVFTNNYVAGRGREFSASHEETPPRATESVARVVCDEEAIAQTNF